MFVVLKHKWKFLFPLCVLIMSLKPVEMCITLNSMQTNLNAYWPSPEAIHCR